MKVFIVKSSVVVLLCGLTTFTFRVIGQQKRKRDNKKRYEIKLKENETKLKVAHQIKELAKRSSPNLKNQNNNLLTIIPQLPIPKWIMIGKVDNLYAYPLISGNEYKVDECEMKFDGIHMIENSIKMKWDRSFIVFDVQTKYVITSKVLSEVSLYIEENCVILQAPNMPCLCSELINKEIVTCDYWCGNIMLTTPKLICIDCGDEIAQWLSKFLKRKENNMRLGYITNSVHVMNTYWHHWAKDCILYREAMQNNKSLSPFVNILNSMLITEEQYEKVSTKLKTFEEDIKYCPNIVISAPSHHLAKAWEWIMIGNVVIQNRLPLQMASRYDKMDMPQDTKYFAIGINCDLQIPGRIKVGDNVYVHFSE